MNNEIQIQEEIYCSDAGAFHVNNAVFNNEPCYCVQNFHNGEIRTVLFNYDESIMRSVVSRMKRTGMSFDRKCTGSGFVFKFNQGKHEPGISLRSFLWSKYKHIPAKQAKKLRILLHDMSSVSSGIIDMRECNLYDSDEITSAEITTLLDSVTGRKFIVVQCEGITEFIDYSPELYQMLTTKGLCYNYQKCIATNRIKVSVHFAKKKNGSVGQNISRFVAIYNKCFGQFKNQKGAIKRFIRKYPVLNERFKEMDGSHVNAYKFNHCRENIMLMPSTVNRSMDNLAARIAGNYRMNPFRYSDGESDKILIEWNIGEESRYIVCNSTEDYADIQNFILGVSKYTKNLEMRNATVLEDHETVISDHNPTPREQSLSRKGVAAGNVEYADVQRMMFQWSADCERVTKLYREHPEIFWEWKNTAEKFSTEDLLRQAIIIFGYSERLPN